MRRNNRTTFLFVSLILVLLACNLPSSPLISASATETVGVNQEVATAPPVATSTATVVHIFNPGSPISGRLVYDVDSSGTAPEKRAPYGDSYDINRLERPFLQDMSYVSDMDIVNFTVAEDADWFYVSIKLIGKDANNPLGINYGVELDTNHDGFGDYAIVASPSYTATWDTTNVKIFQDVNHDTAGRSAEKSDAPITTDGYETQIFHGGIGDADADMAWVRLGSTLDFAFKKSWSGTVFMLGVFSDAGLKDAGKLDYVDRFTEAEAGSPVKDKQYYPLGALFAVDNSCQEAFGFKPTGYEPKLCPRPDVQPTRKPGEPGPTPSQGCPLNDTICAQQGPGYYFDAPTCSCLYFG